MGCCQSLDKQPPLPSLEAIRKKTHNFDEMVGQGTFAEVYKAEIGGYTYAIKKLYGDAQSVEISKKKFESEISALSVINHPNLMRYIGCHNGNDVRLIVSEFYPNHSLLYHLENEQRRTCLTWPKRLRIAIGVAKGLNYLHTKCRPKIIHRDIKPANIVLDDKFKAKVIDFGLVKIFPGGKFSSPASHLSNGSSAGTKAYMDPYYSQLDNHSKKCIISDKLDVYSFGVVLLQLVSGRGHLVENVNIAEWAKPIMKRALDDGGDITELVDPVMLSGATTELFENQMNQMRSMLRCANGSLRENRDDGPNMKQIVEELEMNTINGQDGQNWLCCYNSSNIL